MNRRARRWHTSTVPATMPRARRPLCDENGGQSVQGALPSIQFPVQLFLYAIPCAIYALVRESIYVALRDRRSRCRLGVQRLLGHLGFWVGNALHSVGLLAPDLLG